MTPKRFLRHLAFQSTLLMRGATGSIFIQNRYPSISIHAPHARSDDDRSHAPVLAIVFQSTLLMRGATFTKQSGGVSWNISIHAPHARSDLERVADRYKVHNFNPRSSCEERRQGNTYKCCLQYFNPRSSCEERLDCILHTITALHFNPRSSCEERRLPR